MNILLCVVENRDELKTEYCKFLVQVSWNRSVSGIKFWDGGRCPIWYMRREMIKEALQEHLDMTHILFVDTDVIPQNGFIKQLADHNMPVVSGVYYNMNRKPVNRKFGTPYIGSELEEVDVMSMGLSLIQREVLEKVEYPEPQKSWIPDGDIVFCENVKKAGYKIMQDFNVRGFHLLQAPF